MPAGLRCVASMTGPVVNGLRFVRAVLLVPFLAVVVEASDALNAMLLVDPRYAEDADGLHGILLIVKAWDYHEVNAAVSGHVLNLLAAGQ